MQREIKFRGKRVDNGEWVCGSYHFSADGKYHYILAREKFVDVEPHFCYLHEKEVWQVIPESVGQFTGLKNSLGKEIWEGDIIHCLKKGMQFGAVEQVEFKRGCFILRHRDIPVSVFEEFEDFEDFIDIVVVGNIYENPELLTH